MIDNTKLNQIQIASIVADAKNSQTKYMSLLFFDPYDCSDDLSTQRYNDCNTYNLLISAQYNGNTIHAIVLFYSA